MDYGHSSTQTGHGWDADEPSARIRRWFAEGRLNANEATRELLLISAQRRARGEGAAPPVSAAR